MPGFLHQTRDDGGRKARSIALIISSELSHTGLCSENSGTWVRQTMVTEHRSCYLEWCVIELCAAKLIILMGHQERQKWHNWSNNEAVDVQEDGFGAY